MPSIETSIETALFTRAATLPALLGIPAAAVAWPNITLNPKPATYLRVSHIPNRSRRVLIGAGPHRRQGILQIDVFTPLNKGASGATEQAGKIAAHFPVDHCMSKDRVTAQVMKVPDVAAAMPNDTHWQVPVTVEYLVFG